MGSFLSDVFGGRDPRTIAVAVSRTFLQATLSMLIVESVFNVGMAGWEAVAGGGIAAVLSLLHGYLTPAGPPVGPADPYDQSAELTPDQ